MAVTRRAKATKTKVEKSVRGKLVEDLKAIVADAEELLTVTASQTGEGIATARAKAQETLKAAKVRIAEEEMAVTAKTRAAAKATEDYVRANPWKGVGIAAAIGLVFGILVARR
jgi:ElaB/YqjD/DUF883 family membrane-anchored ribosome-binding protein